MAANGREDADPSLFGAAGQGEYPSPTWTGLGLVGTLRVLDRTLSPSPLAAASQAGLGLGLGLPGLLAGRTRTGLGLPGLAGRPDCFPDSPGAATSICC